MASDTRVGRIQLSSLRSSQSAALIRMTFQALFPIETRLLLGRWHRMGVVTRKAAEASFTTLIAHAGEHLLHMTCDSEAPLFVEAQAANERHPDVVEPFAGTKVRIQPSIAREAFFGGEMALPTDAFPPFGIEFDRINDGVRNNG